LNTLVATTTSSRCAYSRTSRPVISSEAPAEYMSAVSKTLTPSSTARRTIGRASASPSTHGRHSGVPKVIMPSATRETFSPLAPRFT
jgi:hypothetical protein